MQYPERWKKKKSAVSTLPVSIVKDLTKIPMISYGDSEEDGLKNLT